ncbi:chitin deacetylase [Massospora cicadina]|nr:chitin deacetylase [Massospora cicadina]
MKVASLLWFLGASLAEFSDTYRCGNANRGLMCNPNLEFGPCCSAHGYCGSTAAHCSVSNGCQSGCREIVSPQENPQDVGMGSVMRGKKLVLAAKPTVCVNRGQVSLTFEDGPAEYAPYLMTAARHLDIKLTIFVIGSKLSNATYRDYLQHYYLAGHTIASHTFTHPHITNLSDSQLRTELVKADDEIYKYLGVRPILMRSPYAEYDERTAALIQSMGYKSIFASIDTEDTIYSEMSQYCILKNVLDQLGSPFTDSHIITQHDAQKASILYLPSIVAELRKRRFEIVPMDICLGTPHVYRNQTCGDGVCSGYIENCNTCSEDCGTCPEAYGQYDH